MLPLNFADVGQEVIIRKIGGNPQTRKHLENLGFVVGGTATVLTTIDGNLIVKVKEARVALNTEMAQKIMY